MPKLSATGYVLRWPTVDDIGGVYDVFKQGAGNLGGPVMSDSIGRCLKSQKSLFVVLEGPGSHIVGASISRFPTEGVCYHQLFAVSKALRGQGLGGQMIRGILMLLKPHKLDGRDNLWRSHKFFASYPDYNKDVDLLYQALGFNLEGVLKYHTKNQTDLVIRAFYPEKQPIPKEYPKASPVDFQILSTIPESWKIQGGLGLVKPEVYQSHDGLLW